MIYDLNFNLYLIRHGESEVNATPDVMGQNENTPLTKLGEKQAALLGKYFLKNKISFKKIFSSTYKRAFDTANIAITESIPWNIPKNMFVSVIPVASLREYSAGDWNGSSRKLTMTQEIKSKMNIYHNNFLPPNGESLSQVERRASKWLEDELLYNDQFKHLCSPDKPINVACFSHGMTIKTLLHYVMGFDKSIIWKISIGNTSVTKLTFNENGWGVSYINNTSHLEGENV